MRGLINKGLVKWVKVILSVDGGILLSTETIPVNFLRLIESSRPRAENGLWHSLLLHQVYQYTIQCQKMVRYSHHLHSL